MRKHVTNLIQRGQPHNCILNDGSGRVSGKVMASFVRVYSKGNLVHNRYLATVNGKQVAIFQIGGKYCGISNVCAHMLAQSLMAI